jgi:hypothetical protein
MMGVTACGSDKPDDLPASQNASASKSFTLIASAGAASRSEISFSLSDFAAISEYVKYVSNAIIQTSSYVEVTGITSSQAVELKDVTLSLKSDSKKKIVLPVIDSNERFMELTQLTFLQEIMNEIYRRGSSKLVLTYTSTHNLTSPVTLAIKLDGKFTFN